MGFSLSLTILFVKRLMIGLIRLVLATCVHEVYLQSHEMYFAFIFERVCDHKFILDLNHLLFGQILLF